MSAQNALGLVRMFVAISVLVQSAEFFALKREWGHRGIWRWETLREDFAAFPRPICVFLDLAFSKMGFLFVLTTRATAAFMALFFDNGAAYIWTTIFLTSLLVILRFRGSFNGGSDTMTVVVTSALCAHALSSENHFATILCLGYIAFQTTLSYVVAGVVKLQNPRWRSGDALLHFMTSSVYAVPERLRAFATRHARLVRLAAPGIIFFELGFPLAFINPTFAWAAIISAIAFHALIYVTFGFNRFLFAWAATYPAVMYFAAARHH